MHANVHWNDDDSTMAITLAPPVVVAIFHALSEATGVSIEELDSPDVSGRLSLNHGKKKGSFTMKFQQPPECLRSSASETSSD